MKPFLLTIPSNASHSFSARIDRSPGINNIWHYHTELELIYLKKGSGTQFVGDSIKPFKEGDIILVGSNLPHYWQYASKHFDAAAENPTEVYVVHFSNKFWGEEFLKLPENAALKHIIEKAARGIQLTDCTHTRLARLIEDVVTGHDNRKILNLMDALLVIAESAEKQYLASEGFSGYFHELERNRIQAIYNYTLNNYKNRISLDDISGVAKMSRPAFCKFFKARTGKTYSAFVNDIRIGNACRMLLENAMSVKEICFESGFNNFASFHHCFKSITGCTPHQYKKVRH
jgi:AraC-like DNA-binding protein/quercetin dioxygenase-like cupin family protein